MVPVADSKALLRLSLAAAALASTPSLAQLHGINETFEVDESTLVPPGVEQGLWVRSDACPPATLPGHSPPFAMFFGIPAQCDYANGSPVAGERRTYPISLAGLTQPKLRVRYSLETEYAPASYDQARIRVRGAAGDFLVAASNVPGEYSEPNVQILHDSGCSAAVVLGAAAGGLEELAPSPYALTCVVGDPETGTVYGQQEDGSEFYRYVVETGLWERLADAPLAASNNGGAALLNGKIYTTYTAIGSHIGVYDITLGAWSTLPHPLGQSTSNITSDGVQYLYLAVDDSFIRFDPLTGIVTPLPAPGFSFRRWATLAHFEGGVYGLAGDVATEFSRYDVATNAWTSLPPSPGPTGIRGTVDPWTRTLVAHSFNDDSLYRYPVDGGTWTTTPFGGFSILDAGATWLPGPVPGVYFVQGELGPGFARWNDDCAPDPGWRSVLVDLTDLFAGAPAQVEVKLDFASGDDVSNQHPGFFVDDITVFGDRALDGAGAYPDTVSGSVARGSWKFYHVDVPPGAAELRVDVTGATGDVDLFVRRDALPDRQTHDCASVAPGDAPESCVVAAPGHGRWWIGVNKAGTSPFTIAFNVAAASVQFCADDDDLDGYVACPPTCVPPSPADCDCDDADAYSHPGAPELCDGNDNACSGSVPEDEVDEDEDDFVECTDWMDVQNDDPTIDGGGDCDDTDENVLPTTWETCANDLDDDCDGLPDAIDGACGLESGTTRTISAVAAGAAAVVAADVDRDGDVDVVSVSRDDGKLAWYENDGGTPPVFVEHVVRTSDDDLQDLRVVDLDLDGDPDFLTVSDVADELAWYESDGGPPPLFTRRVLRADPDGFGPLQGEFDGANSLEVADLDRDGRPDIVVSSGKDDGVYWCANLPGAGGAIDLTCHAISEDPDGPGTLQGYADFPVRVAVADLDVDGDLDVISASKDDDRIAWYENDGGSPPTFTPHTISDTADGAAAVHAVDANRDGYVDVVAASAQDGKIVVHFNTAAGSEFQEFIVREGLDGANDVTSADFDRDGDVDFAVSVADFNRILVFERGPAEAPQYLERTISDMAFEASGVFAADLDGDGDADLLSASADDDRVAWYENLQIPRLAWFPAELRVPVSDDMDSRGDAAVAVGDVNRDGVADLVVASRDDDRIGWYDGVTLFFTTIVADPDGAGMMQGYADAPVAVDVGDLDRDGDLDVAFASENDGRVGWLENQDNGAFWEPRSVTNAADGARAVRVADVDRDGRLDLLSASYDDGEVDWYENDGVVPPTFIGHTISTMVDGATSVDAADLDGDGDLDVLATSEENNRVLWFENAGASPPWTMRVVTFAADEAQRAIAADLDRDGDLDVVSASKGDDKIAWHESDGAVPPSFVERVIAVDPDGAGIAEGSINGATAVRAADLDGDGDLDLVACAFTGDRVAWFESDGGADPGFTERPAIDAVNGAIAAATVDLDRDGDVDIVSVSRNDDRVVLLHNRLLNDVDGDGFAAEFGDCDDEDADRNPDAEEVCDFVDNDCDGIVDNAALNFVTGEAMVDHVWRSVSIPALHAQPLIFLTPPTYRGVDPGVVRIRRIMPDSFQIRFDEWEYLDGGHYNPEVVGYLALGAGRQTLADGTIVEVGKFDLSGTGALVTRTFQSAFPGTPSLFLTAQTANGGQPVVVRARNVSATGFQAALFEEQALMDGHVTETVAYLAIYNVSGSGRVTADCQSRDFTLQRVLVDSQETPVLSGLLKLEEEKSADAETSHIDESVDVLSVAGLYFAQEVSTAGWDTAALRRIERAFPPGMEWGTMDGVNHVWKRLAFLKTYTDPVVVVKPASFNGSQGGVVRIRNPGPGSLQLRFQEWNYLDGFHPAERVFYLVAERGTHNLAGLRVDAGRTDVFGVLEVQGLKQVDYASTFPSVPVVFASVDSLNGSDAVTARIHNRTASGFRVALQEEQAGDRAHTTESVSWIAIQTGATTSAPGRLVAAFAESIDSQMLPKSFGTTLSRRHPILVADVSSTFGYDPCVVRYRNLTRSSVELFLHEEQSADEETSHLLEDAAVFLAD